MIKWNDRTIGIARLVIGGVSIVIGVAALVLAYLVLPSVTQNHHFCYRSPSRNGTKLHPARFSIRRPSFSASSVPASSQEPIARRSEQNLRLTRLSVSAMRTTPK
jgi:hypothetical protein